MSPQSAYPVTHHQTKTIDGIKIFYREAGPKDGPTVLLLHGFPTSSHMFRNLIPYLADRYRVIAPDYPGYGQSDAPDFKSFPYTFKKFGELLDGLLHQLGVQRYAMYLMDYGAPVGWQLALKDPDAITGLIIQNGNAYDEGLKEFWDPIKVYWADGKKESRDKILNLVTLETTIFQYTDGVSDKTRISPDNWTHDQPLLDRPATPISRWTSCTTIETTCRYIPKCKLGSATSSRRHSSCGARTISFSPSPVRIPISET
jgi:pimeloyl-ACP methyl ester carboxylesterase